MDIVPEGTKVSRDFLLDYFSKSVRADDTHIPVQNDPAYVFSDDDIAGILGVAMLGVCPEYVEDAQHPDLSKIPPKLAYFVILLGKKEVYYRLATSSAPFYPIEAEGASLRKDYRFEHYMSLVRRVEQEYATLWSVYTTNQDVQVGTVVIEGYHYARRNYNSADAPSVEIVRLIPHDQSVDVEWNKFSVFAGLFSCYKIFLSDEPIFDEFENTINETAECVLQEVDIHKTKARIKNLVAGKHYHMLIASMDRNGLTGYVETEFDTKPIPFRS